VPISIIAAMATNRVIGAANRLPWHLPNDLRHFRLTTTGHAVIMGRKNYESIGKPLPGRTNIVVTRNPRFTAPGCLVAHSLAEAIAAAGADDEVFVIGGAQLYAQALPLARRMYLTLVHADVAGDTHFPPFDWQAWRIVSREDHEADDRHPYPYSFLTLERIAS
jgi:dihydrofolate reductase